MKEVHLKGLDEIIYTDESECGLKIYMWVNKKAHTFYGTLSTKYGSIHNNFSINNKHYHLPTGVAHFLEHLKFNEDKSTTAHDYYNKTGCETNAFTTFKYTNYQVWGNQNAKDNIIHLLDFVYNDYFTKSLVKNEKGIIIEEARMGEDDPYTVMLFKHLDNIFINSEYKKLITGSPNDIKNIELDDILMAYNTFYHPQNMFLIVTGNFNPYEISEAVKATMNNKKFKEYIKPVIINNKENKKVNKEYEEININVTNQKIKYGIKIPRKKFKEYDDIHLRIYLNMLLKANFGNSSDFKDELLSKEIISASSNMCEIFDDYVLIMFTIDSEYTEVVIKLLEDALKNLDISEKAFNRIKKGNIAATILEYDDVEYVNGIIQTDIINYNQLIDNKKEIYENLKYDEILSLIKCLDFTNKSILVLKPLDNK